MSSLANEKENLNDNKNFSQINSNKSMNSKSKRPAQTLYVPKHMRNKEEKKSACIQNTTTVNATTDSTESIGLFSNSPINDPSIIGYITDSSLMKQIAPISNNEPAFKSAETDENLILNKLATLNISVNKNTPASTSNNVNKNEIELEKAEDIKQTKPEVTNKSLVKSNDSDWFDMYDDLGQSLDSTQKVKSSKKVNEIDEKVIDYSKFEPHSESLDNDEFAHILEISDFPVEFKNENIFSSIKEIIGHTNFDLKWVDDTHCLGVFANASIASTVLELNNNPFIKAQPMSKATSESKSRAQRVINYMKPYKPRPQTTSFVASRLIGASLGLNGMIPKEKLKAEKKKLDSARDTKRKDRETKDAVWNGK